MGVKKLNGFWLIQNGVMTGTATITSAAQNVQNFDNTGLEITWTGTPTGTISILSSVSAAISQAPAVNYYALSFQPALTQPAGAAGGYLISLNQLPFPYFQVQYVNVSGVGVLNVYLFEKDLN
jgi:hypothetical protein